MTLFPRYVRHKIYQLYVTNLRLHHKAGLSIFTCQVAAVINRPIDIIKVPEYEISRTEVTHPVAFPTNPTGHYSPLPRNVTP